MNSFDDKPRVLSQTATSERRVERRSPVFYRLDITEKSKKHVGYLLDVTLEGMRVRCNGDVDMTTISSLNILFPHWMELGEGLRVTGRFVWTKPAKEGRREGGFVFEGLKQADLLALESLIENVVRAATEDELL